MVVDILLETIYFKLCFKKTLIKDHYFKDKVSKLKVDQKLLLKEEYKQTLNNIDLQATNLLKEAEQKCRKLRVGVVVFNLILLK